MQTQDLIIMENQLFVRFAKSLGALIVSEFLFFPFRARTYTSVSGRLVFHKFLSLYRPVINETERRYHSRHRFHRVHSPRHACRCASSPHSGCSARTPTVPDGAALNPRDDTCGARRGASIRLWGGRHRCAAAGTSPAYVPTWNAGWSSTSTRRISLSTDHLTYRLALANNLSLKISKRNLGEQIKPQMRMWLTLKIEREMRCFI